MGAWGTTLYSNDTTSAIRDEYIKKLNSGEPNEEITMDLIKEFQALICDTEEQALFWYALADMQLSHGMLMQYVRDKALLCMEDIKESERWARPDQDMVTGWVKTLEALKKRLEAELPKNTGKVCFLAGMARGGYTGVFLENLIKQLKEPILW